jgi:hypothetical protein
MGFTPRKKSKINFGASSSLSCKLARFIAVIILFFCFKVV